MTYSGKKGSAMNITVYLGASRGNDPSYEADASALGAWIAEHGHTLIYGGSRTGLMGALSAGALKKGGSVIGVEPQEFIDTALQQEGLTKLIVTPGHGFAQSEDDGTGRYLSGLSRRFRHVRRNQPGHE